MKMKAYVPGFALLLAVCGAALRGQNLISGYEPGTKLPVPGNPAEIALIVLSVLAAIVLVVAARAFRGQRGAEFEQVFSGGGVAFKMVSVVCGLLMIGAGIGGLYLAVAGDAALPASANLPLFPLWLLAILTGGCFIGLAAVITRGNMTESAASLTIVPMFWACFDLIITFKDNGASPFVGLYAFELLAAIALTYTFYMLAGFLYSTSSPARFIFSAGMSLFFCIACVGGAVVSLASGAAVIVPAPSDLLRYVCFFASSMWLFALMVLASRRLKEA